MNGNTKRKLIVSNIQSLDGYYEGKDRNLDALFDYFHEDYAVTRTWIIIILNGCVLPIPWC